MKMESPRIQNDTVLFTKDDVSKHNTEKDCWLQVGHDVYDITSFVKRHPGNI